jgi:hypothetical protein
MPDGSKLTDLLVERLPLKNGNNITKPGSTSLPIKPGSNAPTLKEKTIKTLKELNCSAHWGLEAARVSLGGYSSMRDLEDDLDIA